MDFLCLQFEKENIRVDKILRLIRMLYFGFAWFAAAHSWQAAL